MQYEHTQRGRFALFGLPLAALLLVLAFAARPGPLWGLVAAAAVLGVALLGFTSLTVTDRGERLELRFGPLPLLRRSVRYADVRGFRVARSWLVDGWGVHWVPGRGWTWNVWGRACVELRLRNGLLRIGTDDPEGLAELLAERTGRPR